VSSGSAGNAGLQPGSDLRLLPLPPGTNKRPGWSPAFPGEAESFELRLPGGPTRLASAVAPYPGPNRVLSSRMMLVERPRLCARLFGPLAFALCLHALALGLAAAYGFSVPARVEEAFATLVIELTERPEPLPDPVAAHEPEQSEFSPSDDIPLFVEALEPLPFDLALFDLAALPAESIVKATPLALDSAEITPGAEALGLLTPRIAMKSGPAGGAAPVQGVVQGSRGSPGGDPARGGTAGSASSAATALAIVAAAPRTAVVSEPAPRAAPPPTYPRLSVRAGEEGSVLCRIHISERGEVTEVEVVESSGFERLDEAARATLLGWSFEPRRLDGRSVSSTLLHRVTFRLES